MSRQSLEEAVNETVSLLVSRVAELQAEWTFKDNDIERLGKTAQEALAAAQDASTAVSEYMDSMNKETR